MGDPSLRDVPAVVHQIWLQGLDSMRPEAMALSMQCLRVARASGWLYRLWSDRDLFELPEYAAARALPKRFTHLANLGRAAVLWHLGGLYVDVDTEVFRLPVSLRGAWLAGANNCAMAAPALHPYVWRLLQTLSRPEPYATAASHADLFHSLIRGDVQVWPREAWFGDGVRSFGCHLGRSFAWGSRVDLGDTFPPGATR